MSDFTPRTKEEWITLLQSTDPMQRREANLVLREAMKHANVKNPASVLAKGTAEKADYIFNYQEQVNPMGGGAKARQDDDIPDEEEVEETEVVEEAKPVKAAPKQTKSKAAAEKPASKPAPAKLPSETNEEAGVGELRAMLHTIIEQQNGLAESLEVISNSIRAIISRAEVIENKLLSAEKATNENLEAIGAFVRETHAATILIGMNTPGFSDNYADVYPSLEGNSISSVFGGEESEGND